jgi:hypothetical protein
MMKMEETKRKFTDVYGEEIQLGDIITPIGGPVYQSGIRDRSWMGDPLKVVHVESPFVIIEFLLNDKGDRRSFNFKEWSFKKISKAYVDELMREPTELQEAA